jgi:uncharacterized delta-60 repeat protein
MRTRRSLAVIVSAVAAASVVVAAPVAADPGDMDTSFAGDGATFVPGGAEFDVVTDVGVQSNGRIVVVSNRSTGEDTTEVVVTRFTARGRVDRTFGTQGRTAVTVGGASTAATRLAIQADDGIIVVGRSGDGDAVDMTVLRLDADGALDSDFGTGGHRVVARGNSSELEDVLIDAAGRIVAFGWAETGVATNPILVRLLPDGARDTSFDGNGVQTLPHPGSTSAYGRDLELTSSGRYVIGVEVLRSGGVVETAVGRVRPSGRLDTGFASNGYRRIVTADKEQTLPVGLDVSSTGRIVALVHARDELAPATAHVVALTATGGFDTTFSGDGRTPVRSYEGGWVIERVGDVETDATGRILVGLSEESDRSRDATVAALRPNGRVDRSFSGDGGVTFDFTWETESRITALSVTDARVYVGGLSVDPLFEPVGGGIASVRLS